MSSSSEHWPAPRRGTARGRILEVAAELFVPRGFADVSMQEIADAAGVTKAALYYHFQSKEDLFEAFAQQAVYQFWEGIIARAEAGDSLRDTLTNIAAFAQASLEFVTPSVMADMRRHLSKEAQRRVFQEHPTPEDALAAVFRRAIETGEMRPVDVDVVANMFVAMILGLAGHHGDRPTQPRDLDLAVDVLLNGIAAREPTGRPPASARQPGRARSIPRRGQLQRRLGRAGQGRGGGSRRR